MAPAVTFDVVGLDAVAGAHAGQNGGRKLGGHDERIVDDDRGAAAHETRPLAAAFQAAGTAQLVLDPDRVLVMANDLARRAFGLTTSDFGRPVCELALFSHPVELSEQLDPARRSATIDLPLVRCRTANGERLLNVRIAPLTRRGHLLGSSITYTDVTARHALENQLSATRRQLADACEQLRSMVEQFEIKLEERRSLSRLLDAANEEVLTATERLERRSDELRSIDHERALVHKELHRREAELIEVTALLATILDAVGLPGMGLDQEQLVQMWNRRAMPGKTNEDAHQNGRTKLPYAPHTLQWGHQHARYDRRAPTDETAGR